MRDYDYPSSNMQGNDELYSRDGFASSATNRDASHFESVNNAQYRRDSTYHPPIMNTQSGNNSHFQSMDNVRRSSFSINFQSSANIQNDGITRVGKIIRIIVDMMICVAIILSFMGVYTEGSVFGYEKVEGVISENQHASPWGTYSRGYKPRYRVVVKYTYKDKEYTMMAQSVLPKQVDKKVNIYIYKYNPSDAYYFESKTSFFSFLAPVYIILIFIRIIAAVIFNPNSQVVTKLRDII